MMSLALACRKGIIVIYAIVLTLISATSSFAQEKKKPPLIVLPPTPSTPTATTSGASRGQCLNTGTSVTALVPLTPQGKLGLTVSGNPTLFFEIRQTNIVINVADFAVVDKDNKPVYKTTINLPEKSGAIGVTIPTLNTSEELQVGKSYKWGFALICDPQKRDQDISETGIIQRVNRPDLAAKIEQTPARERYLVYAQAGIWQETLSSLAELRLANPQDAELVNEWKNIWDSVQPKETTTVQSLVQPELGKNYNNYPLLR